MNSDNTSNTSSSAESGSAGNKDSQAPQQEAGRSETLDKMEQGAHRTVNQVADAVAAGMKNAQQAFTKVTENVQQKSRQWKDDGNEWTESLRETVKQTPLTSIATAFLIGALVTHVCRRHP